MKRSVKRPKLHLVGVAVATLVGLGAGAVALGPTAGNAADARAAACAGWSRLLQSGGQGTDVAALQDGLNRVLNAGLATDGIFGPKTKAAVVTFQTQVGLAADGIAGPKTMAALQARLGCGTSGPAITPAPVQAPIAAVVFDRARPSAYFGGATPAAVSAQTWVALRVAYSKLGASYVYGAHGPTTFDCSGLLYWAYRQAGVTIPTNTAGQRTLPKVAVGDLRPGDLMHYPGSGPSGRHVVMFVGRDAAGVAWSIEAKGADYGVVLSSNHTPAGAVMITRPIP